jgi:hypothetical protein
MSISKYLSTAKRNPVTRIRFYQNSVVPIDIVSSEPKKYKINLTLDTRFMIEIENNSEVDKDYAYIVMGKDSNIQYISALNRIEPKSFYRLRTRQKVAMVGNLHTPYLVTPMDHKSKLLIYYRNSKNLPIKKLQSLASLKGMYKIFEVDMTIDSM